MYACERDCGLVLVRRLSSVSSLVADIHVYLAAATKQEEKEKFASSAVTDCTQHSLFLMCWVICESCFIAATKRSQDTRWDIGVCWKKCRGSIHTNQY